MYPHDTKNLKQIAIDYLIATVLAALWLTVPCNTGTSLHHLEYTLGWPLSINTIYLSERNGRIPFSSTISLHVHDKDAMQPPRMRATHMPCGSPIGWPQNYLPTMASMSANSALVKTFFSGAATFSRNCAALLAPIKADVTRLSRSTQDRAI